MHHIVALLGEQVNLQKGKQGVKVLVIIMPSLTVHTIGSKM